MPLTGPIGMAKGAILALSFGTPAAVLNWGGIMSTLGLWLLINTQVIPLGLTASANTVSGQAKITVTGTSSDLGPQLAAAAGSPPSDAQATRLWTIIAEMLILEMNTSAIAVPGDMVSTETPQSPGTVTGLGKVEFLTANLGTNIAAAIQTVDPAGVAGWVSVGASVQDMVAGNCGVVPTALIVPPGGGPITGLANLL